MTYLLPSNCACETHQKGHVPIALQSARLTIRRDVPDGKARFAACCATAASASPALLIRVAKTALQMAVDGDPVEDARRRDSRWVIYHHTRAEPFLESSAVSPIFALCATYWLRTQRIFRLFASALWRSRQ